MAEQHDSIMGWTSQKYRQHVEDLAEDVLDEVAEVVQPCVIEDRIHEVADGSELVIYYGKAHACLWFSDHSDEIDEALGWYKADSFPALLCRAAYFALAADVREQVDRLQEEREAAAENAAANARLAAAAPDLLEALREMLAVSLRVDDLAWADAVGKGKGLGPCDWARQAIAKAQGEEVE